MGRISRDEMLMRVAEDVSMRGTCSRLHVGAVVSRSGRIITTGYNGAPAGLPHCDHAWDEQPMRYVIPESVADRVDWTIAPGRIIEYDGIGPTIQPIDPGCTQAEHAERNAIAYAARHGLALEGAELHTTHAPCLQCARSIINAGLIKVTYSIPYRITDGVELLKQAGLQVVDMPPPVR